MGVFQRFRGHEAVVGVPDIAVFIDGGVRVIPR